MSGLEHPGIWRDERGGLGFTTLWVCFVLIFLIPFFWDIGSLYYARRFAGTGADAAALAAAQEYARQLQHGVFWNGTWRGRCELAEYTPQQVVMRYLTTKPAFSALPAIGIAQAQVYAAQNRDELTAYRAWPEFAGRNVVGVPIPWIVVNVTTRRQVHTAYQPIYGREFSVAHDATAVAYLSQWSVTPRPCSQYTSTYDFTFEWKITLDAARQ